MSRLVEKVALISGGASGIGESCAASLASNGAAVVVADLQDTVGERVVHDISRAGGRAHYVHLDVTSEDDWVAATAETRSKFGRLDILVNSAGIAVREAVVTLSLSNWRRQMAVNLDGAFLGAKHAIPLMREGGRGGSIVNISSMGALRAAPNMSAYCASKAALCSFTRSVALECAEASDAIRVNAILPGIVETPMYSTTKLPGGDGLPTAEEISDFLDDVSARLVPLGRKGLPHDVANAVLWLCSDEASYVTGTDLVVDGGRTLR